MEILQIRSVRTRQRTNQKRVLFVTSSKDQGRFRLSNEAMTELNLDKYAGAFICLENGVYFLGFHSQLVHGQTMPFYKDADKARSRCRFSSTLLARRMLGLTDPSVRAEAAYEVDTVPQMGPGGAAVFRLTKIEATP